ncbi:TIGR03668 family PPOX class F420-dependent oxidoreductase [Paractinoplanes durhamensis]|uniref:PPOX class F420-dependent oxidoreductase n=1 Tax=Paractinoplanes durhamensis TaxID=113563 RepID=A0ABQ3Z070_9ACTN|nr:TIGR03668 family PPOX class F420-dependent oxidoreductase [Actinoplanes durhamensis]GIE03175.1 PPOX class F420-dependent oxidoreductase [Actinoplanes durhamensis]
MTPPERFGAARVARLATAGADLKPHLVPIVFAIDGDTIYSAVDGKPKRSRELRRLANIAANPQVSVLVDHYDEDWTQLWWVRADGVARILDKSPEAVAELRDKYPQYHQISLDGPYLEITVERWSSWVAATPR